MENIIPYDIPLELLRTLRITRVVFFTSLIIGTVLLLAFLFTGEMGWIGIGYFYVLLAIVANLLVLIIMIIHAFRKPDYKSLILRNASLLLVNIPIALAYFWIVMGYLSS